MVVLYRWAWTVLPWECLFCLDTFCSQIALLYIILWNLIWLLLFISVQIVKSCCLYFDLRLFWVHYSVYFPPLQCHFFHFICRIVCHIPHRIRYHLRKSLNSIHLDAWCVKTKGNSLLVNVFWSNFVETFFRKFSS